MVTIFLHFSVFLEDTYSELGHTLPALGCQPLNLEN